MLPTIGDYRWRIANIMIGGTTLRNQGAKGVEEAARKFLANLSLERFIKESEEDFQKELDDQTILLQYALPQGAQNWGAARKAINLFLGAALDHRILCKHYGLERIESFLEVPLDSYVGDELWKAAGGTGNAHIPRWWSIKSLTPEDSQQYQKFAADLAHREGCTRISLDVIFWRTRQ